MATQSIDARPLYFYKDHGLFNDYTGLVGETSEEDRIALALEEKKSCHFTKSRFIVGEAKYRRMCFMVHHYRTQLKTQLLVEATGPRFS